ncbi:MAG: hypothetical protein ABFD89_17195 [Bryobacteraceae bacterium]
MPDIFGDLREWGAVLIQIKRLRLSEHLDEHQEGLIRILRYRYNWQLRQAALRAVADLRNPSKDLFEVLLAIVTDEHSDLDTRLLACDAVRRVVALSQAQGGIDHFEPAAAQRAAEFLRVPQPPVLREAVEQWSVTEREPAARLV